jgi:RimJ/RimL family protein N-acetyltransferase
MSPAAITGRLDALERRGFVRRLPAPDDRRKVIVELTPAGHRIWRAAGAEHGAEEARLRVLDPAYTGHGYATEAVRELLRYCFQDLGVRRVNANCFLGSDASWRLMERAGMRRELHAVRESLHRSGEWLDTVGYAILEEEWQRP